MPGPSLRVAIGLALVLALAGGAAIEVYQGMGSKRPPRRVRSIETSLPPITVDFRDRAVEAGLTAPHVSGGEARKKYILETTGSGVAVLGFDGEGWMGLYIAKGTTAEGVGAVRHGHVL